jgi:hypothetical protein
MEKFCHKVMQPDEKKLMNDNYDNALWIWKLVLKDKKAHGGSVTEKATDYLFANLKIFLTM